MTKKEKAIFDKYQNELFEQFMKYEVDSESYKISYAQLSVIYNLRSMLSAAWCDS